MDLILQETHTHTHTHTQKKKQARSTAENAQNPDLSLCLSVASCISPLDDVHVLMVSLMGGRESDLLGKHFYGQHIYHKGPFEQTGAFLFDPKSGLPLAHQNLQKYLYKCVKSPYLPQEQCIVDDQNSSANPITTMLYHFNDQSTLRVYSSYGHAKSGSLSWNLGIQPSCGHGDAVAHLFRQLDLPRGHSHRIFCAVLWLLG